MTPDEIMRMPEDESLLIFSNCRPVKAKKAFQFKLFPKADSLVNLSQNDYQGQAEASQETKFQDKVAQWEAKIKEKGQQEKVNSMSEEEEGQQQDELDSALEQTSTKNAEKNESEGENHLIG